MRSRSPLLSFRVYRRDQWDERESNSVRLSGVDHRIDRECHLPLHQSVRSFLGSGNRERFGELHLCFSVGQFCPHIKPRPCHRGDVWRVYRGCFGQLRRMVHHGTNGKCPIRSRRIHIYAHRAERRRDGNCRCNEAHHRGFRSCGKNWIRLLRTVREPACVARVP